MSLVVVLTVALAVSVALNVWLVRHFKVQLKAQALALEADAKAKVVAGVDKAAEAVKAEVNKA